jgi:Type II site-specific deoxyribonuclease
MQGSSMFGPGFLEFLKTYVDVHHSIYPTVPPQGIYFEALVEKTFRAINKPLTVIKAGGVNQPRYDILFEGHRISLKTETGLGTKRDLINVTKLCTTEREPWDAGTLKARAIEHLGRYDIILMLRAVWEPATMRYQLVEIPVSLLRLLGDCEPTPVGRRPGRRSLGADVVRGGKVVFRVHFDGSDGKCQIRNLRVEDCKLLLEWEKVREPLAVTPGPRTS